MDDKTQIYDEFLAGNGTALCDALLSCDLLTLYTMRDNLRKLVQAHAELVRLDEIQEIRAANGMNA